MRASTVPAGRAIGRETQCLETLIQICGLIFQPTTNGIHKEITIMRTIASLFAAGLLACSMTAIAANDRGSNDVTANDKGNVVRDGTVKGEYNNECAWGLANGKHVETDCKVNMTREDGKTYCFSSDKAMANFMKEPQRNMSKAKETYGRS